MRVQTWCAIGIQWVEGRDAAKTLTVHTIASTVKENLDQNVSSGENGNPLTCFSSANLPYADAYLTSSFSLSFL